MNVPHGCNRCHVCQKLSPLYQPFPICRDCLEDTCASCQQPGSLRETDGIKGESAVCAGCVDGITIEAVA